MGDFSSIGAQTGTIKLAMAGIGLAEPVSSIVGLLTLYTYVVRTCSVSLMAAYLGQ